MAFVAGILSIVLLQYGGVLKIVANGDSSATDSPAQNASAATEVAKAPVGNTIPAAISNVRLSERMDTLQQQLRDNTLNADKIQAQVGELDEKLETALLEVALLPEQVAVVQEEPSSIANEASSAGRPRGFGGLGNDIEYTSLVAAGVDPLVAEQLKRQNDQWTLQRLELVDQATREGWRRSDEFDERLDVLREQKPDIREELGEQSYDRYLFAAGDFNRVEITSIIDGSAAQLAGIQNGDLVLSYADKRVFSMRELQSATSAGSRGESIQVQVIRNGELLSVDLPRGPLGVTLSGKRVEP